MTARNQLPFSRCVNLSGVKFFILLTFFAIHTAASAAVPEGIATSISSVQSKFAVADKMLLEVSYKNVTDNDIVMLKWGTALEGRVNEDFLSVYFDGDELPYVGRHYKRAAPSPLDYITIAAGAKIVGVVDVLTGYDLDYEGEYHLSMRAEFNAISLKQALTISLSADRPVNFKRTPVVKSCSAGRDSLINSALSAAESIANRARDDLRNTPVSERANARRFVQWFGRYSQGRWNTVQDHFNRIASAVSGRTITFICDDSESAFAYVFPGRPYDVYLGQAFWSAPPTGTDSKAGTIIHELSHFNVLGGTDDLAYGQSAARGLARSNPNGAVRNADSHEYFAENTPNLPMPRPGDGDPADPGADPDPGTDPVPDPDPAATPVIIPMLKILLLDD